MSLLGLLMAFPGPCTSFDDAQVAPAEDLSGFVAVEDAARICSLARQCPRLSASVVASLGVPADDARYSLCVHWLAGPVPANRSGLDVQRATLSCVARAANCDQALACLPVQALALDDPRCGAGVVGRFCADGAVIDCGAGSASRCGSVLHPQTTCVELPEHKDAMCAATDPCSTMAGGGFCEGNVTVACDAVLRRQATTDCSVAGRHCQRTLRDGVSCVSSGAFTACSGQSGARSTERAGNTICGAADAALVCDGDEFSTYDCAALGGACEGHLQSTSAWCTTPGSGCTPLFDGQDTSACDGPSVEVCAGGKRRSVNCARVRPSYRCHARAGALSAYCGPG
jgi:hypothetical protein